MRYLGHVSGVLRPYNRAGMLRRWAWYAGHVHAYERTWPVNNYKMDPCGPVNIIIGASLAYSEILCNHLSIQALKFPCYVGIVSGETGTLSACSCMGYACFASTAGGGLHCQMVLTGMAAQEMEGMSRAHTRTLWTPCRRRTAACR